MIDIQVDPVSLKHVQQRLGDLSAKAPRALKSAINDTARDARKKLANKAQETYVVKTRNFNNDMKIKTATTATLEAIIKTKGQALQIVDFNATPKKPAYGKGRPSAYKGNVLKGTAKNLTHDGRKAFGITANNGHFAIIARTVDYESPDDRKARRNKHTYTFNSPSVPVMVGNEQRVYGIVKPDIESDLEKNVEKEVQKILAKG